MRYCGGALYEVQLQHVQQYSKPHDVLPHLLGVTGGHAPIYTGAEKDTYFLASGTDLTQNLNSYICF